jgi:acetyl-CoA carboxylase biotin carboxyl carrier protein
MTRQGREHEPEWTALAAPAGARIEVRAPAVGLWREAPAPGSLVRPGDTVGRLEVLGVLYRLVAPAGVHGVVMTPAAEDRARQPVSYGQVLLVLDPEVAAGVAHEDAARSSGSAMASGATAAEGPVFRAPSSGRFYSRPGPGRPPFVQPGDEIAVGQTVCMLEVMKTFHRVTFGGKGLPERARVVAVVPVDDTELAAGDIILVLE